MLIYLGTAARPSSQTLFFAVCNLSPIASERESPRKLSSQTGSKAPEPAGLNTPTAGAAFGALRSPSHAGKMPVGGTGTKGQVVNVVNEA